jgi:hypothetical protein
MSKSKTTTPLEIYLSNLKHSSAIRLNSLMNDDNGNTDGDDTSSTLVRAEDGISIDITTDNARVHAMRRGSVTKTDYVPLMMIRRNTMDERHDNTTPPRQQKIIVPDNVQGHPSFPHESIRTPLQQQQSRWDEHGGKSPDQQLCRPKRTSVVTVPTTFELPLVVFSPSERTSSVVQNHPHRPRRHHEMNKHHLILEDADDSNSSRCQKNKKKRNCTIGLPQKLYDLPYSAPSSSPPPSGGDMSFSEYFKNKNDGSSRKIFSTTYIH